MGSKNRKWKILRSLLACAVFCALFLTLLTRAERLLMETNGDRAVVAHEAIPPYSADVVFIGSSHVYGAVIPQKLMDDYGITSVNAASGNQRLWQSVYELEWFLQRQRPKVAVVDLFSLGWVPRGNALGSEGEFGDSYYSFLGLVPRAIPWTNPLKYSVMLRETLLDPYAPPYLSTISVRHPNIWALSREDFLKARGQSISSVTFNYFYLYERYGQSAPQNQAPDPGAALPDFDREQLLRLCQLCHENGIRLVFTGLPQEADAHWLGMMENAASLAREQGAAFLDMQTIAGESGFDYAVDMADSGHVNHEGALKVTDFLGGYLKENYDLPDRRTDPDPRYDVWRKRPYQYAAYAAAHSVEFVQDFDEWVSQAAELNEDYLLILATDQPAGSVTQDNANGDILSLMGVLGLEQAGDWFDEADGYFAILEGPQVREEEAVSGDLDWAAVIDGRPLTLRSKQGENLQIKFDNRVLGCGHQGLNVILYDKVTNKIITSACLSLTGEGISFAH